ncbi:VOC family protein [Sediminibacterium sp. TEGAF015]|uniref:glyoxalase n=1 Tax=Sediminibacterium sp. TEGAF015 TaxID=575378 RepID=UPI0022025B4D|nr:glyoxalase [Sediminibacterium sp. TEGAF015]BDQ11337.1 glyoxalase [Sediminibacterium sp. TEGAF015]
MQFNPVSIRPFLGAKDFDLSRAFYTAMGFTENIINEKLSVFHFKGIAFYLQNAYVKDWVDNTMVFVEVENVGEFWEYLQTLSLTEKFSEVRLVAPKSFDWGTECFVHDPSGILWHFGSFNK